METKGASINSVEVRISQIKANRIERILPIPVYTLEGPPTELLPPGSGVFVIASSESSESVLFDELQLAISKRNLDKVKEATDQIKKLTSKLCEVDIEQALETVSRNQSLADLHFGPKLVVTNAFTVDDVAVTRVFFTYVGGDFDPKEFLMTQYVNAESVPHLKAFVVVHKPSLTEQELEILKRIPEESRRLIFGPAEPVMATPGALVATVTAGLLVAAVGTALGNCAPKFAGIEEIVLPALDRNPNLALRQLIAARREALSQI